MPDDIVIPSSQKLKILVGCPISSRGWVLPHFLNRILNLDFDKKKVVLCFLANNIRDNSLNILREFQKQHKSKYIDILIEKHISPKPFDDQRTHQVRETITYHWLSFLRNRLMKRCIELSCTHFMSIDCDILIKPDLLTRLLMHNVDIVSSLLYNGYLYSDSIEEAYKFPNILEDYGFREYRHIINYRTKFPEKNSIGTLIECHFTGACVLMTKEVCKTTKYGSNYYGEDEPWSFSARQAGFRLFCDISMYSQHVMSPELLERFKDF